MVSKPRDTDAPSGNLPSDYDRQLSTLKDLPGVSHTSPAIKRVMPFLGIGGSVLYVVQTFRQKDENDPKGRSEDTIFLEHVSDAGTVRLVLPPEVAAVIHRQYDALSKQTRKRSAKRVAAADRKARGERPAFLKKVSNE